LGAAFVVTLREGFEAALIIGLILAYLSKIGVDREHGRTVWIGVGAAVILSLIVGGVLFASVGELEGRSEQLFEGIAMLLAAAVLTWMVFWMRRQAATLGGHLREQVGDAILKGGGLALAVVAFIAVAREGLETSLFLFAITEDSSVAVTFIGAALGLVAAIVIGVLFYRGSIRLDLKRFFLITGLLVIGFAAWLLSGAIHEFGEVAGNETLESIGPIVGIIYAVGFVALYLLDARRAPVTESDGPTEPAAATEGSA
jgi:high-affinity iron transporter